MRLAIMEAEVHATVQHSQMVPLLFHRVFVCPRWRLKLLKNAWGSCFGVLYRVIAACMHAGRAVGKTCTKRKAYIAFMLKAIASVYTRHDGEYSLNLRALSQPRLLSSIFFQIRTKMANGLKFKTSETATTTSPFYTRRHREHFNFVKMSNSVN